MENWIKIAFRRKFIVLKSFLYNSTLRYVVWKLLVGLTSFVPLYLYYNQILVDYLVFKILNLHIESVFSSYVCVLRIFENKGNNTENL